MQKIFLKQYRSKRGLSVAKLAELSGRSVGYISEVENERAKKNFSQKWLEDIAEALDITPHQLQYVDPDGPESEREESHPGLQNRTLPICHKTGAGAWIESFDHLDEPIGEIEAAPIYQYRRCRQWFEHLEGDSMNRIYPDGCYLHVVDAFDLAYEPRHDDIVIVERSRDAGFLRQRTAKQIEITGGGVQLWPRSTNPRWQEPILLNETPDDDTVAVHIVGLVVRGIIDPRGA